MNDSTPRSGRIHELDALRGLAALGVVFWHYGVHFDASPLKAIFLPFYNGGFLLVDFFFVLSGYVIARAYWREPRQRHFARNVAARLARMYPLHLVTLLATATLLLLIPDGAAGRVFRLPTNDTWHFVLNLALLNQSGLQQGWSFNTPAWSISTEFLVNVAFLRFITLTKNARLIATAVGVMGALALLATQRPIVSGNYLLGFLDLNLVRCGLGFGAGVAVWFLLHRLGGGRALARRPVLADLAALAALVSLLVLMSACERHPPTWYYLLSILVAVGCVVFVPSAPRVRRLLDRRPLVYLGDISYSTYLIHYPIQLAFFAATPWIGIDFGSPLALLLYLGAVIGISAATHRFIEMPAQQHLLALAARKELASATA